MAYVAVIGERPPQSKRIARRHAIKIRMGLGVISLTAATIALASVFSILYFMQINRLTLAGYEISNLEKQINEYREENKKLSYNVAQKKALTLVENEAKDRLHMVPTGDEVQYFWQEEHRDMLAKQ